MTDPLEDCYCCIGYCTTDPDTGCCLGCGRPSFPVANAGSQASGADRSAIAGAEATSGERLPVEPLP